MPPKLFISYSRTSPEYEQKIRSLADNLISDGVEAILDQYDLREGQEANAFMEQMVTAAEIRKVGLFCDPAYVRKANERRGGVGTESQIVSSELYRQEGESKFVAIIMERSDDENAKPAPAFYTSRIYIDLSANERYDEEYERLLRWIYDKPLNVKPEIGKPPAFLEGSASVTSSTMSRQRRAIEAMRQGRPNAGALAEEFFDAVVTSLDAFRLPRDGTVDGAMVRESIASLRPLRDETIELADLMVRSIEEDRSGTILHSFFEKLLPLRHRPPGVESYRESDFDNFRYLTAELYLAVLGKVIGAHRFDAAIALMEPFYFHSDSRMDPMLPPTAFHAGEIRNLRAGSERRISPEADLMHESVDQKLFREMQQADLVLYIRAQATEFFWYPITLLYDNSYATFEIFARAGSERFLQQLIRLVGVSNAAELRSLVENDTLHRSGDFFRAHGFKLRRAVGLDSLGSRP